MQPLLEARLLACPDLPTLPAVALRVLELCREGDEDLSELARVVESDPAIATKLLRLANSASLATRGRITTLSRAVAIVGTHAAVSTALSFSLVRSRRGREPGGFDHAIFWRRAVFCGIAARALGERGGVDREEAFLAGLIQDLGMLALVRVFPAEYARVWAAAGGDHLRAARLERDAFGFDHVDAGVVLARHWNLPDALCAAIAGSHAPAGQGSPSPLAEVTFLSGPLADVWTGPADEAALARAVAAAEERFGPTQQGWGPAGSARGEGRHAPWSVPDRVASALSQMALAVPEAASDFDLDLGGRELAEAVENQARALLRTRGLPPFPPRAGVIRLPNAERALGEAFHHARVHEAALAAVLVSPVDVGATVDVPALVSGCLRGTDAVAPRPDGALALLFAPAPGGPEAAAARIHEHAASAGTPVAVGWAELKPGDGCPGHGALLAAAEGALAASRAAGGAPARGEVASSQPAGEAGATVHRLRSPS
jgi:HD-like signal output (HDOD) protein